MKTIGVWIALLQAFAASAQTSASTFGYVVGMKGSATVTRSGSTREIRLHFGTIVRRGDLLNVSSASSLTIVCSSLTLPKPLPARYVGGVPCTSKSAPLVVDDSSISALRGGGPLANIPVVVVPRGGKLRGNDFTIRWRPVRGAEQYVIALEGPEVRWSRTVKQATQVRYLTAEQPLIPGRAYKVTVTSGRHSSKEERQPFRGFTVMTAAERRQLEKDEERVRQLRLGEVPTAFVLALLYRSRALHAEAITALEGLSRRSTEAAVWRALGESYMSTGLGLEAERPFLEALQASQRTADTEGATRSRIALGEIYLDRGNKTEALRLWEGAAMELEKSGSAIELQHIRQRISEARDR
jgi:hypothetical protein